MKGPDIPRKRNVMLAIVPSKILQHHWPILKLEQVATCTISMTGTSPWTSKMDEDPTKLTSGTMRSLHGWMMTHQLDPVPRVHPLLRRDHSQRHHNNHQVQAYNRRRCHDHRLAEPRLRRPMQLSDLDPEQHLKVMLNQKEIKIGFQLKTGWREGNLQPWKCDSMLPRTMLVRNSELHSYALARILYFQS